MIFAEYGKYYVLKKDTSKKPQILGETKVISFIQRNEAHLLEAHPTSDTSYVRKGTIVKCIENDGEKVFCFYVPSLNISYLDLLGLDMYEQLSAYPYTTTLWQKINEA